MGPLLFFFTAPKYFFKKTPVTGQVSRPNASAEVLGPESGEAGSQGLRHLNGGYLFPQEWTCHGLRIRTKIIRSGFGLSILSI